ncbi:hypothetical protein Scep_016123 [Stephania cephalantha]|uniref:Uncharacterized protein n=1 Tax=Stephania cephalantha TaxID=152367 RepID=A0AAP0NUC5_9MAGN
MEQGRVEVTNVQDGEGDSCFTSYVDHTLEFTSNVPFGSRAEEVKWVQSRGTSIKFVIVTKSSDAGGDGRRRGRVKMACERSGSYRVTHNELEK